MTSIGPWVAQNVGVTAMSAHGLTCTRAQNNRQLLSYAISNFDESANESVILFSHSAHSNPQAVTHNPLVLLTKQLRLRVPCGVLAGIPKPPAIHICKKMDKKTNIYI